MQKINFFESKPNQKFGMKKAYFLGHPVIQAVEGKRLRPFFRLAKGPGP